MAKHKHDGYHCAKGEIFGGPHSEDMWNEINSTRTISQLRQALYLVCCRIQELESKLTAGQAGEGEG